MIKKKRDLYAVVCHTYSNHEDVEDTYNYIGAPCSGWNDAMYRLARTLAPDVLLYNKHYIEDGMTADLVDIETGEIYGKVIVKRIGLF